MRRWTALWVLGFVGCEPGEGVVAGDTGELGSPTGDPSGGGTPGADPAPTTVPFDPRFETDIVPIFYRSCGATDVACHAAAAYHATPSAEPLRNCIGWLSLLDEPLGSTYDYVNDDEGPVTTGCPDIALYERLTEQVSWQCLNQDEVAMYYVEPGFPMESVLYRKLEGLVCGNGQPMPPGTYPDPVELDTVREWIENGAKRLGDP